MNPRPDSFARRPAAGFSAWLAVCALLSALPALASPPLSLAARDAAGAAAFSAPIANGDSFAIRYTHSVALTPVTEYYKIKNNEIWLDRATYHDFGAGLPHQPEEGQTMSHGGGELSISGYNRRLPNFELRVGRLANHELILPAPDGKTPARIVPLSQIAPPGSVLKFSVEPAP